MPKNGIDTDILGEVFSNPSALEMRRGLCYMWTTLSSEYRVVRIAWNDEGTSDNENTIKNRAHLVHCRVHPAS